MLLIISHQGLEVLIFEAYKNEVLNVLKLFRKNGRILEEEFRTS